MQLPRPNTYIKIRDIEQLKLLCEYKNDEVRFRIEKNIGTELGKFNDGRDFFVWDADGDGYVLSYIPTGHKKLTDDSFLYPTKPMKYKEMKIGDMCYISNEDDRQKWEYRGDFEGHRMFKSPNGTLITSEYFQLIEEKKSVWDLKEGDKYWCVVAYNVTYFGQWDDHEIDFARRDIGNCFLTQEQAEKELEKRKIITRLLRSKEEMGLNKEFRFGQNNYYLIKNDGGHIFFNPTAYTLTSYTLGYFSKESPDYIEKNKTDLELLFNL